VSDEQVLYEAALAFLVTYLPQWLHEVEHGDAIAVRDGFECIVPGCTNRCGSPHHLRFRSQGGPDDAWNLAFLCHTHHLELLHQRGLIRVYGRAPDALVFELGIRPDGTAVEVFVNEERVEDQAIPMSGVTPMPWETSRGDRLAAQHEQRPGRVQPRQEETERLEDLRGPEPNRGVVEIGPELGTNPASWVEGPLAALFMAGRASSRAIGVPRFWLDVT
jgi:hypothetical protein